MSGEREQIDQMIQSVSLWFSRNKQAIRTVLNTSRMLQAQIFITDCSDSPSTLDFRYRTLSEMPLAFEANPGDLSVPADFQYRQVNVVLNQPDSACVRPNHTVLVGPMNMIIDLTAGANVPPYEDTDVMKPGDRLWLLEEQVKHAANPDVVMLMDNEGLAMLFGSVAAIREATGFEYVLQQK